MEIPAAGSTVRTNGRPFWVALGLCSLVLAISIYWQQRWGTVADTSWLITVGERVLSGERLYVDLIEANPPFSVWMYMPAIAAARLAGTAPEVLVHAYVYLICALGLGFAALMARRAGFAENAGLLALLPAFFALLILFPGNAFTERDHLGAALLAPLLVLTAWRIAADAGEQPSRQIAVLAGLAGSIIALVKPYYVVAIIGPALYLAWRKRSLRPLFGIEYWSAAAICLVYLGAILLIHPTFVSEILPLLSETYLRMKLPFWMLLQRYAAGYLLIFVLLKLIRPGLALSPLAAVFGLASLAAAVVLVYQAKGWPYHAYPAIALGLAALLCQTVRPPFLSIRELGGARALLLTGAVLVNAFPFMTTQKPGAELVAAIREASERPTMALIGSDIAAGHPLTRMVKGEWVSAYCSDWLGSFSLYLGAVAHKAGDPTADRYEAIVSDYTASKLAEFQRTEPDIILVQKEDALWRGYFESLDEYAELMIAYRQLSEDDTITAYVRKESAGPFSAQEALRTRTEWRLARRP